MADSRNFRIGLKTYALGQQMVKSVSVSDVALWHMQMLVGDLGICSHLGVSDHDQAVCIQKAEPAGLSRFDAYPGRRLDLHCSSLGKIVLAFAEPVTIQCIPPSRPRFHAL